MSTLPLRARIVESLTYLPTYLTTAGPSMVSTDAVRHRPPARLPQLRAYEVTCYNYAIRANLPFDCEAERTLAGRSLVGVVAQADQVQDDIAATDGSVDVADALKAVGRAPVVATIGDRSTLSCSLSCSRAAGREAEQAESWANGK